MQDLFMIAISNTVVACVLASLAVFCGRVRRNPQLSHALWLLVLVKLVTPPLANIPLPEIPTRLNSPADRSEPGTAEFASPVAATEVFAQPAQVPSLSMEPRELSEPVATPLPTAADLETPISQPVLPSVPVEVEATAELFEVDLTIAESVRPSPSGIEELHDGAEAAATSIAPDVFESAPALDATPAATEQIAPPTIASEVQTPPLSSATKNSSAPALPGVARSAAQFVFPVWMAGSALAFALLLGRCLRFRRIPNAAVEPDRELLDIASEFAQQLGLKRCPRILVADVCVPPLVWGMSLRPVIVLPRPLLDTLTADQRQAVLMHELAHVRRRDHIVRWVEAVVLAVFWWNPLAWWARRSLREAEEECCDAWVVWALPESRKAYGQALLKTVEFLTESPRMPVVAGTAFGGSPFKRRIEMILNRPASRTMSRSSCALVVLLAAAVLPVAAQTASDRPATDPPASDASSLTPTDSIPTDPPAPISEEPALAQPRSSLTPDESKPPVTKRATSARKPVSIFRKLEDPEPADVISNQEPRTVRFPDKRNTRETQFNELRREEKSGTRVQTANEKQLAALARMEERIIRLEKIVTALAKSQDQLIKQSTDGHTVWPSRPVPHIRSETPEDSATLTPAPPDRQKYIDAPIPIPRAENRHAAVSPNGNVIASLHSDSKTTQVDLFDAKKGRRLSTFQLRGTGHSVQFLDDQRLQIRGDKLLHLIAVPTGNLLGTNSVSTGTTSSQVTTVGKSTDAAVVSGVPLETASSVQQLQTVRSLVTALKGLELKREAFEETQKALDRDRTLLRLEMELERTKLQRAESDLARLVESKSAESEVQGQKLSVKEAELLFEKAATVLGFKETELKTAQESQHQLATRIRKAAEELVKRFPGHPDTKKYRELLKEPGATN